MSSAACSLSQLWATEQQPDIRALVAQKQITSPDQLLELLLLDQHMRWQRNLLQPVEEYVAMFSEVGQDPEMLLELVYSDFLLRQRQQEDVELGDYQRRFPEIAERLQRQIELHQHLTSASGFSGTESMEMDVGGQAALGTFAHYELIREIGRGGMGIVYEAQDRRLGRHVALKMLHARQLASDRAIHRLKNEAAAVARLDHPHIVPIYEIAQHRGCDYYTMKLIDGQGLDRHLHLADHPRQAAELMVTVALAVHHAHHHGILHRDLKPSNVLIDRTGQPNLTDFGLARDLNYPSTLTQTDDVVGSPPYMAPEQIDSKRGRLSVATDVYGLGGMLYWLLTGRPPFSGRTYLQVMQAIDKEAPRPPRLDHPQVSIDLETICLKALEKRPENRYSTAKDFAEDLQRYLEGKPIEARPIGLARRGWRWGLRHPTISAMSLVSLLALGLLFVGLTVNARQLAVTNQALHHALEESRRLTRVAETSRQEATQALAAAQQARSRAESSDRDSRRLLYVSKLQLAEQAWRSGDHAAFLQRLLQHQAVEGQPDQRGFEWSYLWARGNIPRTPLMSFEGNSYWVRYSPDGRWIAAGGELGTVQILETVTGLVRHALDTPQDNIRDLVFTPDSTRLAIVGEIGNIDMWDVDTGIRLASFEAGESSRQLAFSPDGQVLATYGSEPAVRLWDAGSGELLVTLSCGDSTVRTMAISPDGRWLAVGSQDRIIRLFDLAERQKVRQLVGHERRLAALDFSGDSQWIVSGSVDRTFRLWDVETGAAEAVYEHLDEVRSVAFHPSGRSVALGDANGTIRLQPVTDDTSEDAALHRMAWSAHQGRTWSLAFSPDGEELVSAGGDGQVYSWQLEEKLSSRMLHPQDDPEVRDVAPSAEGDHAVVVAATSVGIVVWDRHTGDVLRSLHPDRSWKTVAASPSGRMLAAGSDNGDLLIQSMKGDEKQLLPGALGTNGGNRLCFSADGTLLVSSSWKDDVVCVFDVLSAECIATWEARQSWSADISPDKRWVAGVDLDDVLVWDLQEGNLRFRLQGHNNTVRDVRFSPDGKWLATVGNDRQLNIWDAKTGQPKHSIFAHDAEVDSLTFSSDSRSLVTAGKDGALRVWHVATGGRLCELKSPPRPVQHLQLCSDRQQLTALVDTKQIWLLDW